MTQMAVGVGRDEVLRENVDRPGREGRAGRVQRKSVADLRTVPGADSPKQKGQTKELHYVRKA